MKNAIDKENDELVIDKWPNLEEINNTQFDSISEQAQRKNLDVKSLITKIKIVNCPKLTRVDVKNFIGNEELVLYNLPELNYLNCSNNSLKKLEVDNFPKLEILECENNEITDLDLSDCHELRELIAQDNLLKEVKFSKLPGLLRKINLTNNNFPSQDLSIFGRFYRLEVLEVDNKECPKSFLTRKKK